MCPPLRSIQLVPSWHLSTPPGHRTHCQCTQEKSERGKKEVMQCLRQFHSAGCVNQKKPGIFNLRDFDHHREITNQTTFDGGTDEQYIGRLLAVDPTCLPNTRGVVRDRAHAIRTNLKAPLGSDPDLARIKHQLLEKIELPCEAHSIPPSRAKGTHPMPTRHHKN